MKKNSEKRKILIAANNLINLAKLGLVNSPDWNANVEIIHTITRSKL